MFMRAVDSGGGGGRGGGDTWGRLHRLEYPGSAAATGRSARPVRDDAGYLETSRGRADDAPAVGNYSCRRPWHSPSQRGTETRTRKGASRIYVSGSETTEDAETTLRLEGLDWTIEGPKARLYSNEEGTKQNLYNGPRSG